MVSYRGHLVRPNWSYQLDRCLGVVVQPLRRDVLERTGIENTRMTTFIIRASTRDWSPPELAPSPAPHCPAGPRQTGRRGGGCRRRCHSTSCARCRCRRPSPDAPLRVKDINHVWSQSISDCSPEFEGLIGRRMSVQMLTAHQLSNSSDVTLEASASDIDVMMVRALQEQLLFVRNGWLADLAGAHQGRRLRPAGLPGGAARPLGHPAPASPRGPPRRRSRPSRPGGPLAAAALMAVPVIWVAVFGRKYLVVGLAAGETKG